jgi:hypothetical protein
MKTLLIACIMAAAMNAQDFHGVSIGGTDAATITNNSAKPLMGWVMERITTTGCNPLFHDVDYGALTKGTSLQPGQSVTRQMIGVHTFRCRVKGSTGTASVVNEGDVVSWQILAVLFTDGTFYGPDDLFQKMSSDITGVRSMARDMQYLGTAERLKVIDQHKFPPPVRNASTDSAAPGVSPGTLANERD